MSLFLFCATNPSSFIEVDRDYLGRSQPVGIAKGSGITFSGSGWEEGAGAFSNGSSATCVAKCLPGIGLHFMVNICRHVTLLAVRQQPGKSR